MKENYEFGYLSVKAMLLFAVLNQQEETIKNMAFKIHGRKKVLQPHFKGSIRPKAL
ncbi:MAG: hypothetical protein IPJ20_15290 [Flammeovirgaceae bacterium]|nr:hypothetical protein [Flammeovirgaceae bacterium]